ncbi:hypothetical protein [Niveibacterium sp. SC-1]|uniref:hypothetical protein n=1 Tax=Niveibacterium sp. SC-1 TaxID=3135646 RepID=UPI00311F6598
MASVLNESFDEFLDSLKQAGVEITNEAEVRERLAEAARWRRAFMTLVANGQPLGIRFVDHGAADVDSLHNVFERHAFPPSSEALFASRLSADC